MLISILTTGHGTHCFTDRKACGAGSRCNFGHYCVAFCKPRPKSRDGNTTDVRNGMVLISYKQPFIKMLEDQITDIENGQFSAGQIQELFDATFKAGQDDGWRCRDEEVRSISWIAHQASIDMNNAVAMQNAPWYSQEHSKNTAISHLKNIKGRYENLDENRICGEVSLNSNLNIPSFYLFNPRRFQDPTGCPDGRTTIPRRDREPYGRVGQRWFRWVFSWEACGQLCWGDYDVGCKAWSWYSSGHRWQYWCVIMSDYAGLTYSPRVYSGGHHCAKPPKSLLRGCFDSSCLKNRIEDEGKEKFCETSVEALKTKKNNKGMKSLNREVKKYCVKSTVGDEQFIDSLKKLERKQFQDGNDNAGPKNDNRIR